jgi:hypothetical protein
LWGASRFASTFKSKKKVKQYSKRKHKSKINQVTLFGDEPIMAVIPEKIKSTSKIKSTTSVSSESSTTVETVEDKEDSALEKLIDSTEDDLDDVIAQGVKAIPIGAGLDIKFWPLPFNNILRIRNAIPGQGQLESLLKMSTGSKENL